jgi:ABC-type dipeptide/oligopeptide/nickel transport system permease component
MLKRLFSRMVWSVITLIGTAILTFLLVNLAPGDVARVVAGSKASPEVMQTIRERYHLNEPLWKRLGYHLAQLARGDLGHSYVTDQPVLDAILTRLPTTAKLAFMAVVLWMVLAVPLGIWTARNPGSLTDRLVLVGATLTLSLPAFWLARMLQYWLAYKLGWFPVAGYRGLAHLLLPALTIAILAVGYYARLIHTNMLQVLDSSFVRAARARGATERTVLYRHALPNALIPVVTILGMDIAALLGGVMFTENVFALPGIGTLAVQSVFNLDVPIIMGTVMFSALTIVLVNLFVDLLYGWIDPRVRAV